jgi:hypothetical protein
VSPPSPSPNPPLPSPAPQPTPNGSPDSPSGPHHPARPQRLGTDGVPVPLLRVWLPRVSDTDPPPALGPGRGPSEFTHSFLLGRRLLQPER